MTSGETETKDRKITKFRDGFTRFRNLRPMSESQPTFANPFATAFSEISPALSREAAAPLERREDFFRRVIESLSEAVIITDRESRMIYANARVEAFFGYTPDELIGRISYETLLPEREWPDIRRRLQRRLEGVAEEYEKELIEKDGAPHWVRIKGIPYRDDEGSVDGNILVFTCLEKLKELEHQNDYLQTELKGGYGDLVGSSASLRKMVRQMELVAPADAAVLIHGESGTGKELVARGIHERSPRRGKPLIKVNCGAIPENLFESEFFGHARGSFTGAVQDKAGRFELARGGTIFLDEIGELPLAMQAKLLRVVQEKEFERVGEAITRKMDARIVAATNRDLKREVETGRFRQDLFYRLSVFPIDVPPLRERRSDIPALASHFAATSARRMNRKVPVLATEDAERLMAYDWPGNIRELQNVIERAVIVSQNGPLRLDLPGIRAAVPQSPEPPIAPAGVQTRDRLRQAERENILRALEQSGGKVSGPGGAAELLGMRPTTLASRIKALKLSPGLQRG